MIERHLHALGEEISRLESGLAALCAGALPPDDGRRLGGRLEVGDLVIDHDARRVYVDGAEVQLSPTEYRCLHALASNEGRVVEHRHLMRQATGTSLNEPGNLKVYAARLRAKLRAAGAPTALVESVRGIGYRLAERPTGARHGRRRAGSRLHPGALLRLGRRGNAA